MKTSEKLRKKLVELEDKFQDDELPKVSVVIATYNCSQSIALTLESVLTQKYPDFEVIVIDGGSTDRTLEVINGFHDHRIKIYSVTDFQRYEMLNKGISQSTGLYLNFLFPGDYYLSPDSLRYMMCLSLEHEKPQLVFCGTLLRDGKSEVKILYRPLSQALLKKGQQPTSLQSCWFRRDALIELGKFSSSYKMRGGFDLFCRFCRKKHFRSFSSKRVLTDYDLRMVTRGMILSHFWETFRAIYRYFGIFTLLTWLIFQRDTLRLLKSWIRSFKVAFVGSK